MRGPQVGIASALGLATIVAPLSGALATPAQKAIANHIDFAGTAFGATPRFPQRAVEAPRLVERLSVVPAEPIRGALSVPETLLAPGTIFVTRASRDGRERSVLPGCDGQVSNLHPPNGQVPSSDLCTLWDPRHRLRADAAVQLAKLNIAYRQQFGDDICLTDSYRTLAQQRSLHAIKPGLAAEPGTSEHGFGLAIDGCEGIELGSGARYTWMRENAPLYGWDNPSWARRGGSKPEPWHWEYVAGE
jgi:D-alanyl-D-alanine carboxypeptidase